MVHSPVNLSLPTIVLNPTGSPVEPGFYEVLTKAWNEKTHLLKYHHSVAVDKPIPGKHGFIGHLNPARFNKRPSDFKMDKVVQPFDASKFNFTKAHPDESLFQIQVSPLSPSLYSLDPERKPLADLSTSLLMINVSPLGPNHLLLLPRFQECLPQQMDARGLQLALEFLHLLDTPSFRLGFNSFGAYASVNHLHFQGFELEGPTAIERANFETLCSKDGLTLRRTTTFPVRCLEVALESVALADRAARVVAGVCRDLEERNQPYNLFMVDKGRRCILMAQRFEEAKVKGEVPQDLIDTCMNPAVFEIGGHQIFKRQEDFDTFTEERVCELLAHSSISEEAFRQLASQAQDYLEKL